MRKVLFLLVVIINSCSNPDSISESKVNQLPNSLSEESSTTQDVLDDDLSSDNDRDTYGFRDLKLGTHINAYSELQSRHSGTITKNFIRSNENLQAGNVQLDDVILTFYEDTLMQIDVMISIPNLDKMKTDSIKVNDLLTPQVDLFHDYLLEVYGHPHDTIEILNLKKYSWNFTNTEIAFSLTRKEYASLVREKLDDVISQLNTEQSFIIQLLLTGQKNDLSNMVIHRSKWPISRARCSFTLTPLYERSIKKMKLMNGEEERSKILKFKSDAKNALL